ncbi:hypothetical protein PHLCEN_2v12865 [Hermanssonia centrifuga]|uniref:Secreted protein n=1 Tax=Hermanssonia centrifuga TaxID=98765 RepID=A0A2R6NFW5_9APHY|nr:hypothetical protein PHLCEN_2v12865 [Hermanssonia centrifuga]
MLLFVWPTAINTIVLSRFVLNLRSAYWAFDDNNTCLVQVAETITRIVGEVGEGPVHTCDGHHQAPIPTQNHSSELFTDIDSVKY